MAKKASDMERVKPPKRLRGWKLQQAKEAPCQKGLPQDDDGNPLSLRLVELWSQGKLSATQACQIAHLSLLSGCEHLTSWPLQDVGTLVPMLAAPTET